LQRLLPKTTGLQLVDMSISGILMVPMQGEISALSNVARTFGGFGVAYFQIPWATKHGALQTFGVEAACVISVNFMLIFSLTTS
jgi:hypothetical protein